MKLLFLLLVPAFLFAQDTRNSDYRNLENIPVLTGTTTKIKDRAYTGTTKDTTSIIHIGDYANVFLSLQSKDSASIVIDYRLSLDGSTLGASVTLDSLNTTNDAGTVKSVNFSSTSLGAPYAQFIFKVTNGAAQGVSSATYTAKLLHKKY